MQVWNFESVSLEISDQSHNVSLDSKGPDETQAIGRVLGENACPGDVFLLVGDLGAGKTCLTQGILFGLGSDDFARSPTFVLVAQYPGLLTLYHMDLYRLDSFEEVLDLGLDEYIFGDGVSVVEWADKAAEAFPESHMLIEIEQTGEDNRRLKFTANGERYEEILKKIKTHDSIDSQP